MPKKLVLISLIIISCVISSSQDERSTKLELMKSPLNQTINEFGLKFLQRLIKTDENQCNIFISPFSIMLIFTMLLHGTAERSNQQILNAFGYSSNSKLTKEVIHQSFQDLLYEISKKQRNYTLNIGSIGLFKDGLNPNRHFRTKIFEDYNAVIMNLNFKNKKQTEKTLNNWIRTVTSNRVTNLDSKSFNEKNNFVLLNAIYFEGKWRYPFSTLNKQHTFYNQMNSLQSSNRTVLSSPKNGRKEDHFEDKLVELNDKERKKYFNLTDNLTDENAQFRPSNVEMIGNLKPYNYIKSDDGEFELFELPYDGDLSMFIILPNYQIKMQHVLSKLNVTYLNDLIDRMDKYQLRLMLPKFKIEQKLELKNNLKKLGLIDLFNEDANLTPMFSSPVLPVANNQTTNQSINQPINQSSSQPSNLHINQAIHNAFINVDEKGTSVFGSTNLKSLVVSGFKEIIVQVNRPFIFFIKDTTRDIILFSGTLCRFI